MEPKSGQFRIRISVSNTEEMSYHDQWIDLSFKIQDSGFGLFLCIANSEEISDQWIELV